MPTLEREMKLYEDNKARLLAEAEGKFVLIHGDEIAGTFAAEEDAVADGYRRYGLNEPFLVKQILAFEPVVHLYPRLSL